MSPEQAAQNLEAVAVRRRADGQLDEARLFEEYANYVRTLGLDEPPSFRGLVPDRRYQ